MRPAFIEIDQVGRTFDLQDGGQYIALKNIDLKVQQENLFLWWVIPVVVNQPYSI